MQNKCEKVDAGTILPSLISARKTLYGLDLNGDAQALKVEALKQIEAAEAEPTKISISKAIGSLEGFEKAAKASLGAGTAIEGIIHLIRSTGLF
jgi:hypothetical protein